MPAKRGGDGPKPPLRGSNIPPFRGMDGIMSKRKLFITTLLLLLVAVLAVGCAKSRTHYQGLQDQGYQVSVRYDANGGQFTTNTLTLTDSYDISKLPVGADGKVHVHLLPPESQQRDPDFSETLSMPGKYFLAGWYTDRQETVDANGNTVYTYGKKWDFATDTLALDPKGSYTTDTPVLTLYALWLPAFQVEYYDRATGELIEANLVDFTLGNELELPAWNEKTGELDMNDFPEVAGKTFTAAYLDDQGTQPVTGATLAHSGSIDASGQAQNEVMKLYLDYEEGSWYHIYTAKQFNKHARGSNKLLLCADLDFAQEGWNLTTSIFAGTIEGNGHKLQGIQSIYTEGKKKSAGVFGTVESGAVIRDLTLENVSFVMEEGAMTPGTTLGLFAGTIREGAVLENIAITGGKIQVSSEAYFKTDDYSLGLISGAGGATGITAGTILVEAIGENPGKLNLAVSETDGTITITGVEASANP